MKKIREEKATVTAVDLKRNACRCVTDTRRTLYDVQWTNHSGGFGAYGDNVHPQELDRVIVATYDDNSMRITHHLVEPFVRVLPGTNINKQDDEPEDIADYTTMTFEEIEFGTSRPRDQKVGDRVFTTESGGMFGMRRQGTFFARVTSGCQFIMSRFGDLARFVTRNFEHFTDMDSLVKLNSRGVLFSFREVFRTTETSRTEEPSFTEMHGEVAKGETIQKDARLLSADDHASAIGNADAESVDVVRRTRTWDVERTNTSTESEDIHGATHRIIRDKEDNQVTETLVDKVESTTDIQDTTDYNSTHHQDARNIDEDVKNEVDQKYYTSARDASREHVTFDDQGATHKAETHTEGSHHWVRIHNGDGSYYELTETLAHIDVAGNIRMDIDKDKIVVDANGASTVIIHKDGTVVANCTTARVNASSSATIDTPTTNVTGVLNVGGNLNVTGFSALKGGANVG